VPELIGYRNLEAAWLLAREAKKDYCLLVCHEHPLRHHEATLVQDYRNQTSNGGWPHLSNDQRTDFAQRIGTVSWAAILEHWPELAPLPIWDHPRKLNTGGQPPELANP
jgi:hypothetical protein